MWLALFLASGVTYLPGMLLIGLCAALPRATRRVVRILAASGVVFGIVLVAVASVPGPAWLQSAVFGLSLAWLLVGTYADRRAKLRRFLRVTLTLVTAVAFCVECNWQIARRLVDGNIASVAVIGDSLSAGLNPGDEPWPAILAREHLLRVRNLAQSGALTSDARSQAAKLTTDDQAVIVLIGGNNLFAGRPVKDFERDLDAILAAAAHGGRPVIMFELPLVPGMVRYGAAQRALARRHQVLLLPRRRLALALLRDGATTDGVHLTALGSAELASIAWEALAPATR